jgi:hypothetical protein
MDFTLQEMGPFLHWLTLGILCVFPILAAIVAYKLGSLPGAIAASRGHPQAEAINVCGWMGVITLVLWPIAMVWAYTSSGEPAKANGLTQSDTKSLAAKLEQATQRIAAVEAKLSKRASGGGA